MLRLRELYKNHTLIAMTTLLILSVLMSLFLPAKLTFDLFPIFLIIAYIMYLLEKGKAFITILIHVGVIGGVTFITLGAPVFLSFFAFIHAFPTYVVVLATVLILYLLPLKNLTTLKKTILFFAISTILGLNTNLIRLVSGNSGIEKTIHKTLNLKHHQAIKIDANNTTILTAYNKYDFISYGADEACMCGYWIFPEYKTTDLEQILQDKEIVYTQKNRKSKHIMSYLNTTDGTLIEIKSGKKLLSSLYVHDKHLSTSKAKIVSKELDTFKYRLAYLMRHNIWNTVLFWLSKETNYKKDIANFIGESIKTDSKNIDWGKSKQEVTSTLVFSSKEKECAFHKKRKGSKDYRYASNVWRTKHSYKGIKTGNNSFIFTIRGVKYTTKVNSDEFSRFPLGCAYSKGNTKYVFRSSIKKDSTVILWKFSKYGDFLKEIHIKMPKDVFLDKNNQYPISHIVIKRDKIEFRLYNIHKVDDGKEMKKLCSYKLLEIKRSSF